MQGSNVLQFFHVGCGADWSFERSKHFASSVSKVSSILKVTARKIQTFDTD